MHVRFKEEKKGDHVHVTVFVGRDVDHLACAGNLVFRNNEWPTAFAIALGVPWLEHFDPNDELAGPPDARADLLRELVAMGMAYLHYQLNPPPERRRSFFECFEALRGEYRDLASVFFVQLRTARTRAKGPSS